MAGGHRRTMDAHRGGAEPAVPVTNNQADRRDRCNAFQVDFPGSHVSGRVLLTKKQRTPIAAMEPGGSSRFMTQFFGSNTDPSATAGLLTCSGSATLLIAPNTFRAFQHARQS
jgi:hypothetical protein